MTDSTETSTVDTANDEIDGTAIDSTEIDTDALNAEEQPSGPSTSDSGAPVSADDEVRSTTQLEEEGDIAADYIEELLDIADLDGDIDIDTRGGRAYLSVNSSEAAAT